MAVVVDVQTEVYSTVEEEGAAVTHNFKHQPIAFKATEAVEVVRMEAVAVDLGEAAVVQPKWRFSCENLRHAFRIQTKTDP